MKTRSIRNIAILTGAAMATSTLMVAAPAQADTSKNYKIGAAVLGGIALYSLMKGKEVPAAVAGAGAYYAYKKSKDAENDRYSDDRYYDNGYYSSGGNVYPGDDYAYNGGGYNDGYNRYPDQPYYGFSARNQSAATVRPNIRLR